MSRHSTRLTGAPVELRHGRPIFDLGDALNLNVSEASMVGMPAMESQPTSPPAKRRSFKSRDEVEQFLQARKP
jgi:hypothetical protein